MIQSLKNNVSILLGAIVIVSGLFINISDAYAFRNSLCSWNAAEHYCVYYQRYEEGLCHAGGDASCQDVRIPIIIEENEEN